MSNKVVKVDSADVLATVFGSCDANVKLIEKKFGVSIHNRISDSGDDVIVVSGDDDGCVSQAYATVQYLVKMAKYNENINDQSVLYVCDMISSGSSGELEELGDDTHKRQVTSFRKLHSKFKNYIKTFLYQNRR